MTAPDTLIFANPAAQTRALRPEIDAAIARVLDSPVYILGPEVAAFEAAFAAWNGNAHAIGVANGTDALALALRALGIGPGDEVITTPHTAIATIAAIVMSGASPVLADIDPLTLTLDPAAAEMRVNERTRAIIAVHLYGHPCDLDGLGAICTRHGLALIEDCAQAHGALWQGRKVGTIGRIGCFSFYPTKNLGAIGDGGMVVTDDPRLAENVRLLRQYGWRTPQCSTVSGVNSRLDEMQAAILRVKLPHLDAWTARRRAIAGRYSAAFAGSGIITPALSGTIRHAFHLYVIRHPARDQLKAHLAEHGIIAGIHYPLPAHRNPAYDKLCCPDCLPVTDSIVPELLSLPMYPELTDAQIDRVIAAVRGFLHGNP